MEDVSKLVSSDVYTKLTESNLNTNSVFLTMDIHVLSRVTELSIEDLEKIKLELSKIIYKPNRIIRAKHLVPWKRISTGCKSIDLIIRGGIPVGLISEVFGCSGVGKTQFCLQLTLQVQLPIDQGGLEKGAVYICTEDVFPSKRFHQLAKGFQLKSNDLGKDFEGNVFLKHAPDFEQLQKCLSLELPVLMRRENIGLLILDSITGPFRGENEKQYLSRSRDLIYVAHRLSNICAEYNIAVVCINQVSEDIDNKTVIPALGLTWSNSINYRCQISKYNDITLREFEVIFSPDVENQKSRFYITENGLESEGM